MSWITDRLRNSRLAGVAAQLESGEPVDWRRLAQQQAIDMARDGQLALADAIEREEEFDERFEQLLDQLGA
jgi:hypothetical protein